MMRSQRASLLLALACLVALWLLAPGRPMPSDDRADAGPSWTLRLAHLTGPGRLVLRDVLWFRLMSDLSTRPWRAKGEMEVLVKLSPHDVRAWRFLGWHLAFDVASTAIDPQEKQAWLEEAVQQLRQGLRYNPRSHELHYALARVLTPPQVLESYFAEPGPREDEALEHLELASREREPDIEALMLYCTILRRRAGRALLRGELAESVESWRRAAEIHQRLAELRWASATSLTEDAARLSEAQSEYCRAWARLLQNPADARAHAQIEGFERDDERWALLEALE